MAPALHSLARAFGDCQRSLLCVSFALRHVLAGQSLINEFRHSSHEWRVRGQTLVEQVEVVEVYVLKICASWEQFDGAAQ